jgi:hypothetical protein
VAIQKADSASRAQERSFQDLQAPKGPLGVAIVMRANVPAPLPRIGREIGRARCLE